MWARVIKVTGTESTSKSGPKCIKRKKKRPSIQKALIGICAICSSKLMAVYVARVLLTLMPTYSK